MQTSLHLIDIDQRIAEQLGYPNTLNRTYMYTRLNVMIVYHIESMIKEFNKRCKPFSAGICESKDLNVGMQIVNVTINSALEKNL